MVMWNEVPEAVTAGVYKHAGALLYRHQRNPVEAYVLDDELGPIHVKVAKNAPFAPAAKAFDWAGSLVGGPNALTRTLTGTALGALLGYGSGWAAERLFPEKYVERGKASRNLGLLGGALGGLGAGYLFGRPMAAQHGWPGWIKKSDIDPELLAQSIKYASAGGSFVSRIPTDSFSRVIWTRPELSAAAKALTTGLVASASAVKGGAKLVSPFDVARIAIGMGSGGASGMLVGKTLGALAGLTPSAQNAIFNSGVGAGLLLNVLPMVSGGRAHG